MGEESPTLMLAFSASLASKYILLPIVTSPLLLILVLESFFDMSHYISMIVLT